MTCALSENHTSALRGSIPSAGIETNSSDPQEMNSSMPEPLDVFESGFPEMNSSMLEPLDFSEWHSGGFNPSAFCRTRGREGQNCISDRAYEYCSAGNPQPALSRDCWQKRGRYSRCHDGGIGLTYGECDDPFCRQQSGPPRYFCEGNTVVSCSGTGPHSAATPRAIQYCSDRQTNQGGCTATEHYTCQASYGQAQCVYSGTTYNSNCR